VKLYPVLPCAAQAQGFRADTAQYGAVLSVLTDCGVLPAQLKAMQLFQIAARQGLLRCGRSVSDPFQQCYRGAGLCVVDRRMEHESCDGSTARATSGAPAAAGSSQDPFSEATNHTQPAWDDNHAGDHQLSRSHACPEAAFSSSQTDASVFSSTTAFLAYLPSAQPALSATVVPCRIPYAVVWTLTLALTLTLTLTRPLTLTPNLCRRTSSGEGQGVQVSSPALAVLAALRWLAEGRAAFGAAALQKQQEAAAVGAGEGGSVTRATLRWQGTGAGQCTLKLPSHVVGNS